MQCLNIKTIQVSLKLIVRLSMAMILIKSHDLLITNLKTFGFSNVVLKLIFDYLRGRKQRKSVEES